MVGINPIPGVTADLEGTINLRGRVVPVVDLRRRFGVAETPYEVRTRILIVGYGGKPLGLIVDDVIDVIECSPEERSFDLSEWNGSANAPVAKVIKVEGQAYAVLDLRHLFDAALPLDAIAKKEPHESQSTGR